MGYIEIINLANKFFDAEKISMANWDVFYHMFQGQPDMKKYDGKEVEYYICLRNPILKKKIALLVRKDSTLFATVAGLIDFKDCMYQTVKEAIEHA